MLQNNARSIDTESAYGIKNAKNQKHDIEVQQQTTTKTTTTAQKKQKNKKNMLEDSNVNLSSKKDWKRNCSEYFCNDIRE